MRIVGRLLTTSLVLTAVLVPAVPATGAVPAPGQSVIVLRQGQTFRAGQVFKWGGWTLTLSHGELDLSKPNVRPWDTPTRGSGANHLVFQRDGNLVLYTPNNKPVWWTRTYGLGLTHGVVRLFWGTKAGHCVPGEPGGLELSGVLAGGSSSYVWTSCELTNMFENSALASTSPHGGGMGSPSTFVFLWYQNNGNLGLYRFNNAPGGPPATLLWQSHTSGRSSLLFGFNPAKNGPALYNGSFNTPPVWSETGITVSGLPYRWFAVQNDGNFVLYASSDPAHTKDIRAIWDTGTASR